MFYNNTQKGIWFPSLDARNNDTFLTVSNSSFTNNGNGGIVCAVLSENVLTNKKVNIVVEHSKFSNNSASTASGSAVYFHLDTNDNNAYNVSIQYCNFTNNNNQTVLIFTSESRMSSHVVIIK